MCMQWQKFTSLGLLLFAFPCLFSADAAWSAKSEPYIYQNVEYGIQLSVAAGLRPCFANAAQHDTGIFLLFGKTGNCRDFSTQQNISIFLTTNVTTPLNTPADFLSHLCTDVAGARCVAAPKGLHIAGAISKAKRQNFPDGWLDITVVAMAGSDEYGDHPFYIYVATLHTTPAFLGEDLKVFRQELKTIKIWQPAIDRPIPR
jgi:hypothetical protein